MKFENEVYKGWTIIYPHTTETGFKFTEYKIYKNSAWLPGIKEGLLEELEFQTLQQAKAYIDNIIKCHCCDSEITKDEGNLCEECWTYVCGDCYDSDCNLCGDCYECLPECTLCGDKMFGNEEDVCENCILEGKCNNV